MKHSDDFKEALLILCILTSILLGVVELTAKTTTIDNAKLKIVSSKVLYEGETKVRHESIGNKEYVIRPKDLQKYETILEYKGKQFKFDDWYTYAKCHMLFFTKEYIRGKVIEKEYSDGKKKYKIESLYFN